MTPQKNKKQGEKLPATLTPRTWDIGGETPAVSDSAREYYMKNKIESQAADRYLPKGTLEKFAKNLRKMHQI